MSPPPRRWSSAQSPLIYRVHDQPALEKLAALREFLATLDIKLAKGRALRARATSTASSSASRARDAEQLVNEVVLRSQAQAEYAPTTSAISAWSLRRYAHFTSPIRRYADLLVHRALIRALQLGDGGLPDSRRWRRSPIARQHLRHRAARHGGRARHRRPPDRAFPRRPRRRDFRRPHHPASRAPGLFVKLDETGADGFIPARTLGDGFLPSRRAHHALIGERTTASLPSRRPRRGEARRGDPGRRRAALRVPVRRPLRHRTPWRKVGIAPAAAQAYGKASPQAAARKEEAMNAHDMMKFPALIQRPLSPCDVARLSRPLPELRPGRNVSRVFEGRRSLRRLRRGIASPSRRRRARLFRHRDHRAYRRRARASSSNSRFARHSGFHSSSGFR